MNEIILLEGRSHSNDVSVPNRVDQYSADEKSDTVVRCVLDIVVGGRSVCAVIRVVRSMMLRSETLVKLISRLHLRLEVVGH